MRNNKNVTTSDRIEALARTAIFGAVPPFRLEALAHTARERQLSRGEILFTRGDPADGLYVVVSGSIRAFRESKDGREQTIHVETAGATLAEVAVFDRGVYPSTTMAEQESALLFLHTDAVLSFLRENPEAAIAALTLLASRLRNITRRLEGITLQDVGQRLAQLLSETAARTAPAQGEISFVLPESHQRIAATLGTVREVITRQLHRFASEGLIAVDGRRITILDPARLRAKIG